MGERPHAKRGGVYTYMSYTIEQLTQQIKSYASLEDDYDGQGSIPPDTESIQRALDFLALLNLDVCSPSNVSTSSGGIVFEWNGEPNLPLLLEAYIGWRYDSFLYWNPPEDSRQISKQDFLKYVG